jgi:hypothetical protein
MDDQAGAEPGWMGGEMNGRSGWFPVAYVEKIMDDHIGNGKISDMDEAKVEEDKFAAFGNGADTNFTFPVAGTTSPPTADSVFADDKFAIR